VKSFNSVYQVHSYNHTYCYFEGW